MMVNLRARSVLPDCTVTGSSMAVETRRGARHFSASSADGARRRAAERELVSSSTASSLHFSAELFTGSKLPLVVSVFHVRHLPAQRFGAAVDALPSPRARAASSSVLVWSRSASSISCLRASRSLEDRASRSPTVRDHRP